MTRRGPLLLTGPVVPAPVPMTSDAVASSMAGERTQSISAVPVITTVERAEENPSSPEAGVWERLAPSPATRSFQALFRPASVVTAPLASIAVEMPKPSFERFAEDAGTRIEAFLAGSGGRVRGDRAVLFFWDLGKFICESRRDFPELDDAAFDGRLSAALLAKWGDTSAEGRKAGFDVEACFAPASLADMRRLVRVFPRDYLERFARPLAVMPGGAWTYVREIASLPDPYERVYYAEMASRFQWKIGTLRRHIQMRRFQTYTVARQPDERLQKAFVDLSKGDLAEWIYRDLLRFDFLNGGEAFREKKEPNFQKFMMERMDRIADEFGEGILFKGNQAVRYYENADGSPSVIRLDVLADVNDGHETYPLVIELKKGVFDNAVRAQCELYRDVIRGKDESGRVIEPGGYLMPNQSKAVVMALVTDFDREFENVMEVGLSKIGRRSSIFVALYTFKKPPQRFLDRAIGKQLRQSAERAAHDIVRLRAQEEVFVAGSDYGEAQGLFAAIMARPMGVEKDHQSPF